MVEFSGTVYKLTDDQAKLLAENLRNYAMGTFPADVKLVTGLGTQVGEHLTQPAAHVDRASDANSGRVAQDRQLAVGHSEREPEISVILAIF
jgi:hypothetical protein